MIGSKSGHRTVEPREGNGPLSLALFPRRGEGKPNERQDPKVGCFDLAYLRSFTFSGHGGVESVQILK